MIKSATTSCLIDKSVNWRLNIWWFSVSDVCCFNSLSYITINRAYLGWKLSLVAALVMTFKTHTVWPSGVELLHGVIQANADWGKAHLSLQPCHQSTVQTPRALSLHHGEDGAKHTPVFHPLAFQWGLGFTLDLQSQRCTESKSYKNSLTGHTWCMETFMTLTCSNMHMLKFPSCSVPSVSCFVTTVRKYSLTSNLHASKISL